MDESFGSPVDFLYEETPWKFPWVNVVLFLVTCLSTLVLGAIWTAEFNHISSDLIDIFWRNPSTLLSGWPFSVTVMTILFAHEMGHYLTCRYYRISASLPYFIPAPTLVGTMGAFIRIRSPFRTRPSLLDVGIAGPIAGFVFAVPALIIALRLSPFVAHDPSQAAFELGEPLIFKLIAFLMGRTAPPGMDLRLHPVGLAAWFGFFATALNLLPVGQLDGGHVCYALSKSFHRKISLALLVTLVPLGIFYWQGWLLWSTVLLFIGLRHPATVDDSVPLEPRHIWLGWIALAMFILCFTPIPVYMNGL
jgi:membrane-associated protease RseP (regulator of RpoE activity)